MWNPFRICLFPAITGTITENGDPVAVLKIVRECIMNNHIYRDYQLTDDTGRFAFPAMNKWSLNKWSPFDSPISQKMIAIREGQEYLLWDFIKMDLVLGAEVAEGSGQAHLPIEVTAELQDEPMRTVIGGNFIDGLFVILNNPSQRKTL